MLIITLTPVIYKVFLQKTPEIQKNGDLCIFFVVNSYKMVFRGAAKGH